jgi:hypothetical protein
VRRRRSTSPTTSVAGWRRAAASGASAAPGVSTRLRSLRSARAPASRSPNFPVKSPPRTVARVPRGEHRSRCARPSQRGVQGVPARGVRPAQTLQGNRRPRGEGSDPLMLCAPPPTPRRKFSGFAAHMARSNKIHAPRRAAALGDVRGRGPRRRPHVSIIRDVYESYGFEPLETPAIEYTGCAGRPARPDRPNEVFSFQTRTSSGLPATTGPPCLPATSPRTSIDRLPFRATVGPVWRNEKLAPAASASSPSSTPTRWERTTSRGCRDLHARGGYAGGARHQARRLCDKVNNRKVLDGVLA